MSSGYPYHDAPPPGVHAGGNVLGGKIQYARNAAFDLAGAPAESESAIEKVRRTLTASSSLAERVNRLADRIAGAMCTSGGPRPTSLGCAALIPDLVEQAESAKFDIDNANSALTRLEALFGI